MLAKGSVEDWLREGLSAHQNGRLAEAEALYGRVLAKDPKNAEALYLLGTAAGQRGQWRESAELIRHAIAVRPGEARYYNNLGIALKRQGLAEEAIAAYRKALQRQPDSPEALSNLGNLLCLAGHAEEAVGLCRRAVQSRPGYVEAIFNLGVALDATGAHEEAQQAYRRAIELQPKLAEAHYRLGLGFKAEKQWERALECFDHAVQLRPGMSEGLNESGVILETLGRGDEAMDMYRQAIGQNPRNALAQNNLANMHKAKGQLAEAIEGYRAALRGAPEFPEAWYNLGGALAANDQRSQAIDAYQKAIALRPEYAAAHNNLGALWREMGRHEEAIACFHKALHYEPGLTSAMNNLGVTQHALQRYDEAITAYRRALEKDVKYVEAMSNLAAALNVTGKIDEAIALCQRALQLDPAHAGAHNNLGNCWKQRGELGEAIAAFRQAAEIRGDAVGHSNLVYSLHFHPDYSPRAILEEHREWNRRHAEPLAREIAPHVNERSPGRRLRIGYVSPDFREHPIGRLLVGPLAAHDPAAVEVFCYSDVIVADAITQRTRAAAHTWRNIAGMGDEEVAALVRADQIDVLVDLAMHLNGNRMLMFARKPAPVQVTWLAYPGTTGMPAIDYRISDLHLDPVGENDAWYTEKTVRLPDTFWCYQAMGGEPEVNALPAAENRASGNRGAVVTFGCLNNFCKVNEGVVRLWARVMRGAKEAGLDPRMIILAPEGDRRNWACEIFEREGVEPERLEFAGQMPQAEYLQTYHRIDIGLDTFPYNGHTTSLDSFFMGVPVVTLVGGTIVGRAGLCQLMNLGLPELVAWTAEQYVAIALGLAGDLPRLGNLRLALRARMEKSPLMDTRRFARNLEHAYRGMWKQWCASQSSRPAAP